MLHLKKIMKLISLSLLWNSYKSYVRKIVLPHEDGLVKDVGYWRNELFVSILTIIAPVSLVALIPSLYISLLNDLRLVVVADILAFSVIIFLLLNRTVTLTVRKLIFISSIFCLAIILLLNIDKSAPGLLFLLAVTIISSIIFSYAASYYSSVANAIVCIVIGILIYVDADIPLAHSFTIGAWIAVSSNLVVISIVCAELLNLLLKGLATSLQEKKVLAANLTAIIENTDAFIYSLDRDLRYITFNHSVKNSIIQLYGAEIKSGDCALDIIEKSSSEESTFWRDAYLSALNGKTNRFEKDLKFGENNFILSFTINPISENNKVIGLSCFAADITERKKSEWETINLLNSVQRKNNDFQQFSYIVSHNLRSPITKIQGLVSILDGESEENKVLLEQLAVEATHLDDVVKDINTIVSARRSEKEKFTTVVFETELKLITDVLQQEIIKSGAIITSDFKEVPQIHTIKSYLYSILYNLISNAIKYRQPEAALRIDIKTTTDQEFVCLSVKDNGMGMDLVRNSKNVFGLYKRFHEGTIPGKGIGLHLVKTHAESLGGRVEIESIVNEGTTFNVYINKKYGNTFSG